MKAKARSWNIRAGDRQENQRGHYQILFFFFCTKVSVLEDIQHVEQHEFLKLLI